LLFHAEAQYHLGDEATARTFVNFVRGRARASGTDPNALPALGDEVSGADLLEAIYHERRVELGLEGHRFFDLVRQGRAAQVLADQGFAAGVNEVFPIPEVEITLSGGNITQNNGY
jgi:hypothetical protein